MQLEWWKICQIKSNQTKNYYKMPFPKSHPVIDMAMFSLREKHVINSAQTVFTANLFNASPDKSFLQITTTVILRNSL